MSSFSGKIMGELRGAIVRSAFASLKLALDPGEVELTTPKSQEFGDISSPICFRLAARLGKSPQEISQKLAGSLAKMKSEGFTISPPVNGFLNFAFTSSSFQKLLDSPLLEGKSFGQNKLGKKRRAIVEFSSPNIGKPMHIGHIRSTILGDSVSRILKASGYRAISSNYLCEAGLQTAKLLLAIRLFKTKKIDSELDLLDLYVKIHKEMEANPELEKQAQELVLKMEKGDGEVLTQLSKVRKLSVAPFNRNYSLLKINFDEEVYDSDYVENGKALVNEAIEAGIAFRDKNGEVVASLEEKFGIPNLIILRSNGTTLYSTRDLGLADRQFSKHHFDLRIYVTASEQNLHFRQVFAILKALGKPYSDKLRHIGFGLISLEEGKLSTREGRVLLLEDVINDAISLAKEEIVKYTRGRGGTLDDAVEKDTGGTRYIGDLANSAIPQGKDEIIRKKMAISGEDVDKIAGMVGIAALKYSILKISSEKDIKFSMRDAVKFDGNTAAYLQYTCVRAKNIQRKALDGKKGISSSSGEKFPQPGLISKGKVHPSKSNANYPFNPDEKKLILLISQYPQTVEHAARNLSPYIICDYLFKLALQFSSFYDSCPVLKAESLAAREIRLGIVAVTETTMQNGLAMLGIGVPEKM